MRKLLLHSLCVASLSISVSLPAASEAIRVPIGQQGFSQPISRPTTGMTKSQVKAKYGEPKKWGAAVGEPPISSWVYDGFTVYFEYEHVIHSVLTPSTTSRVNANY